MTKKLMQSSTVSPAMTTPSDKAKEIYEKFNSLLTEESEEEGIEHDAYMLMAGYLSEIERLQSEQGFNRGELARRIKVSSSYLTQVFRGDKPLNFITLAKIKRALDIRFEVNAVPIHQVAYQAPADQKTAIVVDGNFHKSTSSHYFTSKAGGLSNKIKAVS